MEKGEIAGATIDGPEKKLDLTLAKRPPTAVAKKRGGLSFLRTAAFMVRRRSTSKKAPPLYKESGEPGNDAAWKNLVDGMRPLHVPQLEAPPPPPAVLFVRSESFHDVLLPPPSPCSSSVDGMSRYASAEDLRALDTSGEDDNNYDEEENCNGEEEKNAINLKAEEFITRFYEQMRLQRISIDTEKEAY